MSDAFFVNGGGIGLEALQRRISEHLGSEVIIEPSTYDVGSQHKPSRSSTQTYFRALKVIFSVPLNRKQL